ncbi:MULTISPECIES: tRNA lysidine(34) synthetase TilS [unclassified Xanthobacter]|uniref:tRNA lysidine(34) synthetase TilS n=1 Tax=unclassified Xanthobacter TaxID=2623496 RepID=UPI001EDF3475
MSAADAAPLDAAAAARLFAGFLDFPRLVIAVSGGPDSTALLWLAARWRAGRGDGPELIAVTVDHALRPDSAAEAQGVGALCARLGIAHRILVWTGEKPRQGLQAAARDARYGLLGEAAAAFAASAVALAHTRDDQAETVLFRLGRGSGLTGLAAMRPRVARGGLTLLRPLLDVPKARLVATLEAAGVPFVRDPANTNPRFARARLRQLAPRLAEEGLDARRLAQLAARVARADAALEAATDAAAPLCTPQGEAIALNAAALASLPEEVALRLLGRVLARIGTEGPVELGKLEQLHDALRARMSAGSGPRFRRTLAGAVVTLGPDRVTVTAAPPRRQRR